MSKENEQMNALMGGASGTPGGNGGEDWKAMYESLKAKYDADRPMLGRVRELSEKDRRISELEKENERLRTAGAATDMVAQLTPEERGDLPEDYLGAAAKLASRATDAALKGVNEEMARMRMEREEERAAGREAERARFIERINARFPKFLSSISEGGANVKAWSEFLAMNAGSVKMALENMDFGVLEYHIVRFYKEVLEVNPPKGGEGVATAPDPTSQGGGRPSTTEGGEKIYTASEYDALDEKCEKLRRKGDFVEYRKLRDELESALSEGRVKDE